MKQFELPENVKNVLVQYLSNKPYAEVSQLIQVITTLKEINQEVKEACLQN